MRETAAKAKTLHEVATADICVIGGGPGGLAVASAAARLGVPVILIEHGTLGSGSLNHGSVPSKALLAAAKRAEAVRTASAFGVEVTAFGIDYGRVHDHVHGVIASLAVNDSAERFTGLGVRVIQAEARFRDRRTVEAGNVVVRAKRFVIAAGSRAAIPDIPGLAEVPYLTPETIFNVSEMMHHLIVVGGGATGIELAQAYRLLGVHVSLVEEGMCLGEFDREAAAAVLRRLKSEQVVLHIGKRIVRAEPSLQGVALHLEGGDGTEVLRGSHLLFATGRTPNIEGLALERARIKLRGGAIKVNAQCKTSNGRVYAIGDVLGGTMSTHAATFQATTVIRSALPGPAAKLTAPPIPRVLFTTPEIAEIGLQEDAARATHKTIRILRWPYADNDRAVIEREADGFIKVITTRSGSILGVAIAGAGASELIPLWIIAMQRDLKIGDITELVLPYPTLAELSKSVAFTFSRRALTGRATRGILDFIRRFR